TTLAADSTINTIGSVQWDQSISGNYRITKTGTGLSSLSNNYLRLSGSNNIAGVTVNSGILGYKNKYALGTGTLILADGVTVGQDGAVLNTATADTVADRTLANNISILGNATFGLGASSSYFSGNVDLNNAIRTLTLANTTYFSGSITNGGLLVQRLDTDLTSSKVLYLNGANTYSGGTTVNGVAGRTNNVTLGLGNNDALGTGSLTFSGGGTNIIRAVTLSTADQNRTITNNIAINSGVTVSVDTITNLVTFGTGVAVTNDVSVNMVLNGNISGAGSLTKTNANILTLGGANTYAGGTTVSGGTLIGTTESLQGTITNNAAVTFNQSSSGSYNGVISGSGLLSKTGSGTVTLGGNNTYSGGTIVSAGTLIGTTASLQGTITNNAAVTFNQSSSGSYNGVMSGTGLLNKSDVGTVTLAGNNTFTGGTKVIGGTLALSGSGSLGALNGAVSIEAGTIDLGGMARTNGAFTLDAGTLRNGTFTASSYALTNAGTVSAVLAGSGALTKSGAGTATLSRTNTYSGATTVSQGTLLVDTTGSIASSSATVNGGLLNVNGTAGSVTVNDGGSLGGSGSVGELSLNRGGLLNPGNSPGTLTAAQAIVMGGSTYNWQISNSGAGTTAGTDWDLFSVGGLLNMSNVTDANKWNLVVTA
ncbi:MAG: hypothetical protein EBU92_12025, partial [Betaproteobacteria bacterium]|nr:hypothetical protein [Betaproteobacteria bacterium]